MNNDRTLLFRRVRSGTILVGSMICLLGNGCSSELPSRPDSPKWPVTDVYHGVQVTEDYRWLENFNDPAVQQWSEQQNRHARSVLDRIPFQPSIRARLEELLSDTSAEYGDVKYRQGAFFALKLEPPKEQKFLVTFTSLNDLSAERSVVDPNEMDPEGLIAIDWYVPSLDGQRVAVCLSEGGSELGTVHLFEVATDRELADVIHRVNGPTAGGSLAWNADGSGFYYTRYPREGERAAEDVSFYQQVYFHRLGTSAEEDAYCIGEEFPRIAEIDLQNSNDGRAILATVANGDGGEFAHYLFGISEKWEQMTHFDDGISRACFGPDQSVYLLSMKGAPRGEILRLPSGVTELSQAKTVVPESDVVVRDFVPSAGKLYVIDDLGGPSQIRIFESQGLQQGPVPVKPNSSIGGMIALEGDEVLFNISSYVDPPAWYTFDPLIGQVTQTALKVTSPADFSDIEVVREHVISKDGIHIPMNILRPRGVEPDSQSPTLLTGYGGYGNSRRPRFHAELRIWLDHGGIWVDTNLRGGGEFGEDWYLAGNLTNKQNVFDDFLTCAQHLIDAGYTHPDKLAIEGGSNGGLLMGAALTQRPDLFRAVVSHAGIYDMLRVELDPNGAFNVTEFGTVKDPDQFRALFAYSPYHRVVDGTDYPDVLFLTGRNDGRVNPAHSRKMIARLQAADRRQGYILLRTSETSGHGRGTALSERIAEDADVFAFLFDRLGMEYEP